MSKTVAEMNIAIAVSVLAKYQKYQPDLGYTLEGGSGQPILAGTYRPVNYALIQEGIEWLDWVDTMKDKDKDKDKEEAEVKSYSFKSRYTVGDRVMHTDFGKGLVRDLIGDFKIRVAFRDFEKVLVHGIN